MSKNSKKVKERKRKRHAGKVPGMSRENVVYAQSDIGFDSVYSAKQWLAKHILNGDVEINEIQPDGSKRKLNESEKFAFVIRFLDGEIDMSRVNF